MRKYERSKVVKDEVETMQEEMVLTCVKEPSQFFSWRNFEE